MKTIRALIFFGLCQCAFGQSGYVVSPHQSVRGQGTASLRVVNTRADSRYILLWRYRRGAGPWSIWLAQGRRAAHLLPSASYSVGFALRFSTLTPPANEPVALSPGEAETLTVRWP